MVLRIPHGWGWLPFLLSVVRHQDWEFDGEIEDLGLPWSPERLELIKRGEADPTEEEPSVAAEPSAANWPPVGAGSRG